jgi:hypothetical protein
MMEPRDPPRRGQTRSETVPTLHLFLAPRIVALRLVSVARDATTITPRRTRADLARHRTRRQRLPGLPEHTRPAGLPRAARRCRRPLPVAPLRLLPDGESRAPARRDDVADAVRGDPAPCTGSTASASTADTAGTDTSTRGDSNRSRSSGTRTCSSRLDTSCSTPSLPASAVIRQTGRGAATG